MVDFAMSVNPHPRIQLTGVVDGEDIDKLQAAVAPLLAQGPSTVTIDLSGITAASPRLATWLVDLAGQVEWVVLRSPSTVVRQLLDLAGLANRFVFA
jgi:anti-anti-sigma regulatory factor